MKKRLSSLLSALLLAAASCAACGEASQAPAQTPSDTQSQQTEAMNEETAAANPLDAIAEDDLGGFTLRILYDTVSSWWIISLNADELNGEIINDTVYERNRFVEQKLNVKITSQDTDQAMNLVSKSVKAGADEYDMVWERMNQLIAASQNGYLHRIDDISTISWDPKWWDSNSIDAFTINGKLFFVCSDINVHTVEGCSAMYFSKTLIGNHGLENPYQLVRDGKWTIGKMGEMMKVVAADTNGDGKRSDGDTFGLITGIGQYLSLVNGAGVQLVYKTSEGGSDDFVLNIANDKVVEVTEMVSSLINDKNLSVIVNDDSWGYNSFYTDHSLFYIMQLGSVVGMRDKMESDFGILPFPMYSESQGYYTTSMEATAQAMCIPASSPSADKIGEIAEAMAIYSDAFLTDAYYETTLKGKIARDEDTNEMLDILTATRTFDYSTCFSAWGVYDKYLASVRKHGSEELASLQAKITDAFEKSKQKTIDAFAEI
ncbi:MAG: hypothetical protein K6D94_09030 [Clostridiales bacterium]|nr:hypothetical protein [Clostridiales bacterium]